MNRAGASARQELASDICFVVSSMPYKPDSGLAVLAPRQVPTGARCPVCGAFPARTADWAAQVIFDNGDAYFFDSPLSLFIYLRNLPRFAPGRHATEIGASYVRSMADGRWIASGAATYVRGSSVSGPMRQGNLPAFADAAEARHFIEQRGGELVHAADISNQLWRGLDPRHMHE